MGSQNTNMSVLKILALFYDYRESLTIIDGMVLKDKRIVIPAGLHEQVLENLHRSHMGIVKMKERASTSMFWPKIYDDIENFLPRCRPCMSHKIKQAAEPLEHDVPTKPWCSLMLDNPKEVVMYSCLHIPLCTFLILYPG